MPQPRKHASPAERQAAFRARTEQARQAELATKGLPALPVIASIPGWPRWNATFRMAHELIDGAVCEMRDYYDDRSDAWQQSERGEDHQERITSAEAVLEVLSELIS